MDEDSGSIQTEPTPQPTEPQQEGGSALGKAANIGQNLKEGASKAKDIIGAAGGGVGDGISGGVGGALGKGLGALSGSKSGGGSLDGIKAPGGPKAPGGASTPSMFKGMEGDSDPAKKNDLGGETGGSKNPAANDFQNKAKSTGQKASQAVDDAVKTAKDVQNISRAVGSSGTDVAADLELAKELAHPVELAKRGGRLLKYFAIFEFLQIALILAILAPFFFGLYKVYLSVKSVTKNPLNIVNDLRVSTEMGGYLAKAVTSLAYEREQSQQGKNGVAFADSNTQKNYNLSQRKINPETEKMFAAWDNGGLAAKFLDDYHAKVVPNGSISKQIDSYDPSAWDLYVNDRDVGPLSSNRARAFISVFAEDTTHWSDIYTRVALKDAAKTKFDNSTFKLELPDSKKNLEASRENTTKKIVGDTLKPISGNADKYYGCLIEGGSGNCDSLGLGSESSPSNNPPPASCNTGNPLTLAVCVAYNTVTSILQNLNNKKLATTDNLKQFSTSKADEITADSSKYENKSSLAANITTSASDSILKGVDSSTQGVPDSDSLVQLYDQFQNATDNQNLSRVNYDRTSKQSVAESENYFIAGGQLLNNDMGITDSWALTENLSTLESSQTFRAAVLGNPTGLYAQSSNGLQDKTCQKVYDDEGPVKSIKDNSVSRGVKNSSCFTQSLVPNISEFKNEKTLNQIYDQLDAQSKKQTSCTGGWIKCILAGVFDKKVSDYQKQLIRKSPVSTAAVSIDESLSPDFDAYTNQVYGVSKTGAEVDGQAYDTLKIAAESLWSVAATNPSTSIGGNYQNDASVAKTMQYAAQFERLKLAYKPLSQRMLSLKSPDSLAGKLALLAPTNARSGVSKTLALMSPTNLTSAVASRMTPMTFAQSATTTATVNPVGAVRVGYSSSDPSNTMDSQKLWDTYNCGGGGVTQETAQPDGIPFKLPSSVDPCARESVLSRVTTCYFDSADTCSSDSGSSTSPTSNSSTSGTVGDIGESSGGPNGVPCATGSKDLGDVESRYTASLRKDNPLIIKLCQIPSIAGRGNDTSGNNVEGGIVVNSRVSGAWVALGEAAQKDGVSLSGSSFRLADSCGGTGTGTACAKPGTSMHQLGIAIDFSNMGSKGGSTSSCSGRKGATNDPRWQWLFKNAEKYGIKQYSYEPWHWDTSGFANRCDSSQPARY